MNLKIARIPAAYEGLDSDSSANVVKPTQAPLILNYLPGKSGRLYQRGPVKDTHLTVSAVDAKTFICGALIGNDKVLFGFKDTNNTARFIEPWVAVWKPSAATALAKAAVAANVEKIVNFDTQTVANLTPTSRLYVPGPRRTRFGKYDYAIAYDSDGDTAAAPGGNEIENTNYGGAERVTRILRWNTTGALNPVYYDNMPRGAQDLRVWYNQLLVLGGRDPVTIVNGIDHSAIWYTVPLTANDFASGINNVDSAAPWSDPVTVQTNKLSLSDDYADPGVAFAAVGRSLAILKRRSITVLSGTGPDSWQLRTSVQGIGCIDPRSVVEIEGGCFFMSQHGYMFFDGVQVRNVSEKINRLLLTPALQRMGDNFYSGSSTETGGYIIATLLDANTILLAVGKVNFLTSGVDVESGDIALLFHIPSGSWTRFENYNFSGTNYVPAALGRTERYPFVGDPYKVVRANYVSTPEQAPESNRGIDTGGQVIATKWHSRVVELASPTHHATLHRVIIDYEWIVDGSTSEAQYIGPSVSLYNSHGSLLDATVLPSQSDDQLEVTRGRYVWDTFVQTSDLQVRIDYVSTARALVQSSIIDVWIEYQPGSPSRGVFTTQ